jgi:serine phosphatase RsbU (regulator of sigma subunit)
VATTLLGLAGLVVVAALPTQSPVWLSVSSVFALLCGATASRIIHTELLQSRQEAAADRAAQAQAYKTMFAERAEEHAEFTTAMTERLSGRERDLEELEGTLVLAEKRAIEAEARVLRESRRANQADETIAELRGALEIRQAEEADELASWDASLHLQGELDTVVDLLAWEDKANAGKQAADEEARKKHA